MARNRLSEPLLRPDSPALFLLALALSALLLVDYLNALLGLVRGVKVYLNP